MNNSIGKSKTPLQYKVFHTLLGFAVFFSLITVPAEAQVIQIHGILTSSELLWWPVVFFVLRLIHGVYGFAYLRHAVYAVLLFHAIYVLFLKFAIWLPASSFWKMQEPYTQVLGRDFVYLIKSSLFLWVCALLPIRFASSANHKYYGYIFWVSLVAFCFLDMGWLNMHKNTPDTQIVVPLLIFGLLNIFYNWLSVVIARIEHIESPIQSDRHLL
ncbi:TPA: hypothetical protein ACIZBP_002147 [Legionella pneumophila]